MPRVAVPVTVIGRKATVPPTPYAAVTGDATNNHYVENDGRVRIEAKNTGATSRTITFLKEATVDGDAVTPTPITIAAGATLKRAGFPTNIYGTRLNIDVSHAEITLIADTIQTG
ncbi:hypothetical protein ACIBSV_46835 [Embleya sp. NPDC050154]|uniref:hypothetical protein n=1 Tax=Embleya sp. NPDC050154 TaxID=3363988 RepID=UPI0037A76A5A